MEAKISKTQLNFIHLLRAFAALLIVNSHSDKLFPSAVSFLGTGGTFGNAIFFFTSGFTLTNSILKKGTSYLPWLEKRIIRLYPSVIIFMIVTSLVLNQYYKWYDWVFFNGSWFLQAILIYYIIFYPLIRLWKWSIWYLIGINFILFVAYYIYIGDYQNWVVDTMDNPSRLHWVYYFMPMLLGAQLSINKGSSSRQENYITNKLLVFLIFLFSICLFYLPKYLVTHFPVPSNIQLIYPIFLLFNVYWFYRSFLIVAKFLNENKSSKLNDAIIWVANLTLDIYIVHFTFVHAIRDSSILFPLNYILVIILVLFFAYILNKCSDLFIKFFNSLKSKIYDKEYR